MNSSPSSRGASYRYVLRPALRSPAVLYGIVLLAFAGAHLWGLRGMVIALSAWIGLSALMLCRTGERLLARSFLDWKTLDMNAVFGPAVEAELRRVLGPDFQRYDWYVEKSDDLNAMAIGGHAIAVTTRLIDSHRRHQMEDEHVVALVLHEYGHHRGELVRFGAALTLLMRPWAVTHQYARAFARGFANPKIRVKDKLIVGFVLALSFLVVVQLLGHRVGVVSLSVAGMVCLLALSALLEARLMRAEELRADQVAAELGYGGSLRAVCNIFQDTIPSRLHWYKRATMHHPSFARRAALLPPHNDFPFEASFSPAGGSL